MPEASDPNDASKWLWITNPFEIALIFGGAVLGMFAFTSATQSFVLTKINNFERIGLIIIIPFLMLPKLVTTHLGLPNYYLSYAIGVGIYAVIYFGQKVKFKKEQQLIAA